MTSAARQTQSFLRQRFEEAGIRPETRHGQNFLIDLNLLDLLIGAANPGPHDVVLEVGTGLGSLTTRLAALAAHVVTVEIDPHLHQLASEELANFANVTMLQQDALQDKNTMDAAVLDAVQAQLGVDPQRRFKLAANLPYNVATPILSNLLTTRPLPVSLTATIQHELAERICAQPGTKDYSALSIWMQAQCEIENVRTIPPQAFWPRPKVQSAIIHIVPSAAKRSRIDDLGFFHRFVRGLFLHRRKFLRGVMATILKDKLSKPQVDEILAVFRFPADVRAEQLSVESLIELANAVGKRCPDTSS
jgi:16S rRNA (adenine1518-N6/adenine1519-N6)-dimethyltransferase